MAIEKLINNSLKQLHFKIRSSGNGSGSGKGSSARSDITCHKCGKKGHIQKGCKSKGNGSSNKLPKKSTNELLEWVNRKPIVSDTKDLTTATMNSNNKNYKWCISCNNGQGAWGFHRKDGHKEWGNKQGKKPYVCFSTLTTMQ